MTTARKNYSTAVMLFNENIRAIKVIYDTRENDKHQTSYMFKTVDPEIQKDDYVVIPTDTRHGFTVVQVEEVDVDVDFQDSKKIKWIVGKVDTPSYTNIIEEEEKWIDAIKASEKRKLKEEIKQNMMELYNDDETDISKLPITALGSSNAIEDKKSKKKKK